MSLTKDLEIIFNRDLDKLRDEVSLYQNEEDLWKISGEISNCAGNLCLHICGNLQHFFGAFYGGSDYVRNREDEFQLKNINREELLKEIDNASDAVKLGLEKLENQNLELILPEELNRGNMTYIQLAIHLSGHLMYHLGQINYHRRLLAS